jgi:hypothetical protein
MTMRVRVVLMLMAAVATMGLAGCGHYTCSAGFGASTCTPGTTGTGPGSPAAFVYFADDNNGNINAALLDTAGNFADVSGFVEPTFTPAIDGGMVVVQGKWLYMPVSGGEILSYSIDATTGALTAMTTTFTDNSFSISSDPLGQFLFLTGENSGEISVFQISQTDGSLTQVVGSPFPVGGFAWSAVTDGKGKFLYVTEGPEGDAISAYTIGANGVPGALGTVPGSPFVGAPFNMWQVRGEPTGNFLLGTSGLVGINGESVDNHIYVFNINQTTGAISQATGSPFATQFSPLFIAVHPSGNFVYSFTENSTGDNTAMEGFALSSTGTLTELTTSPFTSFTESTGMFDQSGAYLFTHPVGSLGVLNVDLSTGALTETVVTDLGIGTNFGWAPADAQ